MLKNLFDTESSRTQTKRPVFELHHAPLLEQLDVLPLRVAHLSRAPPRAPPRGTRVPARMRVSRKTLTLTLALYR